MKLTGRRRHRANWRGKFILQVEQTYKAMISWNRPPSPQNEKDAYEWRDANVKDLLIEDRNGEV
jgi:hypothetical protein